MAKLTKKQYVRKRLFAGVTIFIAIALITSGLAVGLLFNALTSTAEGSVSVAEVASSPLSFSSIKIDGAEIKDGFAASDGFIFGAEPGDKSGRITTDGESEAKLYIDVRGMILKAQYLNEFTYKIELPAGVVEAARKGYVNISDYYDFDRNEAKEIAVPFSSSDMRTDGVESVLDFNFRIQLGWGEFFKYENPSVYYDTQYYNDDGTIDYESGIYVSEETAFAVLSDLRDVIYQGGAESPKYTLSLIARA